MYADLKFFFNHVVDQLDYGWSSSDDKLDAAIRLTEAESWVRNSGATISWAGVTVTLHDAKGQWLIEGLAHTDDATEDGRRTDEARLAYQWLSNGSH